MRSMPIVFGRKIWKGNVTKVFVNDSFGRIVQTLRFCCPNSLGRIFLGKIGQGNPYQRVQQQNQRLPATIPKKQLTKTSVMFPKLSSQRSHALRLDTRDCAQICIVHKRPLYSNLFHEYLKAFLINFSSRGQREYTLVPTFACINVQSSTQYPNKLLYLCQ